MSYDEAKADADGVHKDIKVGPFDVTCKIFSAEDSSKMKIQFFNDSRQFRGCSRKKTTSKGRA
jgi:hypothetical protein